MNAILMKRNPAPHAMHLLQRLVGNGILLLAAFLLANSWNGANAAEPQPLNALQEINFAGLPGDQVQITFKLSQPASNPASFTIDNPARIAFDLPATKSELAKRSQAIGIGPAKSITAVEVKGRTRVVLNLFEMVPYETRAEGDQIIVVLGAAGAINTTTPSASAISSSTAPAASSAAAAVTNVDFWLTSPITSSPLKFVKPPRKNRNSAGNRNSATPVNACH